MSCDKYGGRGSVPAYVNFRLRATFSSGSFTYMAWSSVS